MKKMSDLRGRAMGPFFAAALLFLGFFLAGCSRESGQAPASPLADASKKGSPILEVEGTVFTNADFETYVRNTVGKRSGPLTAPALSRLFSFPDPGKPNNGHPFHPPQKYDRPCLSLLPFTSDNKTQNKF